MERHTNFEIKNEGGKMKKIYLLITLISIIALAGCGGGSSSGSSGTGSTTDSTTEGASSGGEVSTDVLTYATFGEALSNAMPAALKIAEILYVAPSDNY